MSYISPGHDEEAEREWRMREVKPKWYELGDVNGVPLLVYGMQHPESMRPWCRPLFKLAGRLLRK